MQQLRSANSGGLESILLIMLEAPLMTPLLLLLVMVMMRT
jgi:hypothetical protein